MTIILRPYQQELIDKAREKLKSVRRLLIQAPTGSGKCLGVNTPIIMFDGSIKKVQDVIVGDKLMGPDNSPRTVISLARGREMMYRITPNKGDHFVCNESHILSLKAGEGRGNHILPDGTKVLDGEICNISVKDFLSMGSSFQVSAKAWRVPIQFESKNKLSIPPYVLGCWIGDGNSSGASITTADSAIAREFIGFGKKLGLQATIRQNSEYSVSIRITKGRKSSEKNPFLDLLRSYSLINNKHIPNSYLISSKKNRLELLAGLLDTDGYYNNVSYYITQKSQVIAEQIKFLALSLGFAVSMRSVQKKCYNNGKVGTYFSLIISGDLVQIPVRLQRKKAKPRRINKNHLISGISVSPVGIDNYYGFELCGNDKLFLLGDFTVTHNTALAASITHGALQKNNSIMFCVHRHELMMQAAKAMDHFGIQYGFISPKFTPKPHCMVQIAMIDTLRSRVDKVPVPTIFCADECHHVVSPTYRKIIEHYHNNGSIILGFTATPQRLDGKPLNDLFDDMVLGPSIKHLIALGHLAKYKYYAPPSLVDFTGMKKKFGDYDAKEQALRVDKPMVFGDAIQHYKTLLPGKRAIAFHVNIKASQHFEAQCISEGITCKHVDGEMPANERAKAIQSFERGETLILSNVALFGEGFDVPAVDAVILLRKTASLALYLQMCGRMMRPHESKECGVILDHMNSVELHGLPNRDREWSLEGDKKSNKKKSQEVVPIRQCPRCYSVFVPAPVCPNCGHDMGPVPKEFQLVDVELQEIIEAQIKKDKRMEVGQARTLADLNKIAKDRGYANGWARKIFQARGGK